MRALSYNVPDTYKTSWRPGVLNDSLRSGRVIPVCINHDRSRVVGKVVDFTDSPGGLDLELRLASPDAVPDAKMIRSLLLDRMIEGVSIGFAEGASEPDPIRQGVRRFTRAKLVEVSFVVDASVPDARVLAVRSAQRRRSSAVDLDVQVALARMKLNRMRP